MSDNHSIQNRCYGYNYVNSLTNSIHVNQPSLCNMYTTCTVICLYKLLLCKTPLSCRSHSIKERNQMKCSYNMQKPRKLDGTRWGSQRILEIGRLSVVDRCLQNVLSAPCISYQQIIKGRKKQMWLISEKKHLHSEG